MRHTFRTALRSTFVAAVAVALSGVASAQQQFLDAVGDPANPSFFTLDFGKNGGISSAEITQTIYRLELNGDAARFVNYAQTAEPLFLPGGVSTGDLTISVVPNSSCGTYDEVSGTFSTTEYYAIEFTGDLSLYGLTSPVYLPGASNGTIDPDNGKITSLWNGIGMLDNPFDPPNPIIFSYACTVNSIYTASAGCTGDVNGDGAVDQADLAALLASYGAGIGDPGYNAGADLDGDCSVDQADLAGLLAAYDTACR